MIKTLRLLCVPTCGMLLGACGGSSDGGPLPVDYATITGNNAAAIAGVVLGSSLEGGPIGEYARLLALSGSISPLPSSVGVSQVGAALTTAKSIIAPRAPLPFDAPIAPTTSPCSVGGSVTLSGDISSTQTLTAGDTIVFEFDACDDGVIVVAGTFEMTITGFSGDFVSGTFAFDVDAMLTDFHVTENGVTSPSIDGTVSIGLDITSAPSLGLTVNADTLTVSQGFAAHSLEMFTLTETSDSTTGAYTLTMAGRATSTDFMDAVDFTTPVALQSLDGGNPFTGRVEITGNAGATIAVIVLDSASVRLEVDEDGDGTVDQFIDTTWDSLT